MELDSAEYELERFPELVYRPVVGECVLLVFRSGKVIVTDGPTQKSAAEVFHALQYTVFSSFGSTEDTN